MDYFISGQWSVVGFCSGVVAGLVGITPASGFVPVWSSIIIGILSAVAANYASNLTHYFKIDDALSIFSIHAVAGFVGNLCTAVFAADYIAHLDGYTIIVSPEPSFDCFCLGLRPESPISEGPWPTPDV